MKKLFFSILLLFLNSYPMIFSQTQEPIGNFLKSQFENFQYEEIISFSDSILKSNSKISRDDSIQIFYYRSIAAFHIWDIALSEESFKTLLQLDKDFKLDSTEVSPKIISFFNQIRKKEIESQVHSEQNQNFKSLNNSLNEDLRKNFTLYREAIWKNLIFPGWGNLVMKERGKGYLILSSFSISLISSVYFYLDTNSKEEAYLNEVNVDKILERYKSYNTSYKIRNISLITLGLIYIYSQFDIISRNTISENNSIPNLSFRFFNPYQIQINLHLPF